MIEFLQAAFLTMPTAIFSVLLILVILYWLTVIFGALDLELFDGLFEAADGLAEGAVEGAMEGAMEGLAETADAVTERPGCLSQLGFGEVPYSISGSLIIFFAWVFSYGGMALAGKIAAVALGGIALILGVALIAVVLAVGATAVALRPISKLVVGEASTVRQDLVGRVCTVTTQSVDEKFGQAEVSDRGAAILIQVRSIEVNVLTRGSKALIFQYDRANEVFQVMPADEVPAELEQESD
ncbi:MAG: glycine zipper family protein [bacterium]|nr:glycine zipper family protein [bacterium]